MNKGDKSTDIKTEPTKTVQTSSANKKPVDWGSVPTKETEYSFKPSKAIYRDRKNAQ